MWTRAFNPQAVRLNCKHPPHLQVGLSEQTAEFSGVLRAALRGSDVHQQLQTQTRCFDP